MADIIRNDNKIRQIQAIASVPLGLNYVRVTGSLVNVAASSFRSIAVTTTPDSDRLSIWNWLYTVMIDGDDVDHVWPSGSAINTGAGATDLAYLVDVADHIDFFRSNDRSNIRTHLIRIKNNDTNPHTITFYYKAYTQAGVTS